MESLEQPPVPGGGQGDVVIVGKPARPITANHADREVFVDNDHVRRVSGSVVVVGAREQRVRVGDLFERSPELVCEVSGRDPAQDLAAIVTEARVAGATAEPSFLEELICNRHERKSTTRLRPRDPSLGASAKGCSATVNANLTRVSSRVHRADVVIRPCPLWYAHLG